MQANLPQPTSILSQLRRLSFIGLVAAFLVLPAFGQGGSKGVITGQITDTSGAVLPGAQVKLAPSGVVTATDRQGEFTITDVTPGTYSLSVSYVGFTSFSKNIAVDAGKTAHLDAALTVASKNEEVVVTAERPHDIAEAVNRERTADDIINVLPSRVIRSLPNANIADVAGRMPGVTLERDEGEGKYVQVRGTEPRLTNVTIDGVGVPPPEATVRQVKLDTVPADIVEAVEVEKTLSANQDADAIGGTVNLITKTAGELPTMSFQALGGFTPIVNTRYVGQTVATIGQRFLDNKHLGILVSGSYDYNGRGIDDIEPSPDPNYAVPFYDSQDLREYRYRRWRLGVGGSVDYKLTDDSGVYMRYLYSDFKDFGDKWKYTLNNGGAPQYSGSNRSPDYRIESISFGGKHVLDNALLTWEAAFARSMQSAAAGNPGYDFQYNGPSTDAAGNPLCNYLGAQNIHTPSWAGACMAPPFYDPNNWSLLDAQTTSGITSQINLMGAVSYARNYHLGSHASTFEVGMKFRNAHKGQDAVSPIWDQTTLNQNALPPTPLMTQFLFGFKNPNYFYGDYQLGPLTSFNKIMADLNNLANSGVLPLDQEQTVFQSASSNYDLSERIGATYAMNTVNIGRWRLQAGIRFEFTQLNILGYVVNQTQNADGTLTAAVNPAPSNFWYWDPLPSVQARYQLTDNSDIRAVYGRGISRPNPYDLVPYVTVDQTTNPYTVDVGNPNLKPEHANNFDLLYEHYLKPYGKIQGGWFYKQLSQPIYYINDPHYTGSEYPQYVGDQFSYIINGVNAWVTGLEFAYIQNLGFLPGPLSGFGVMANFTWTDSRAGSLPLRTDDPQLQRQAPVSWNFSPSYDHGRFSSRLGLTYTSANIYQYQWTQCTPSQAAGAGCEDPAYLGPKGPAGDIYFFPHIQVDAQASYRVSRTLTALAQGLNLTNMVFGFYNGSPNYMIQREHYMPTYTFGVRWEPRRED
jgi:TonB-dependent receptor